MIKVSIRIKREPSQIPIERSNVDLGIKVSIRIKREPSQIFIMMKMKTVIHGFNSHQARTFSNLNAPCDTPQHHC